MRFEKKKFFLLFLEAFVYSPLSLFKYFTSHLFRTWNGEITIIIIHFFTHLLSIFFFFSASSTTTLIGISILSENFFFFHFFSCCLCCFRIVVALVYLFQSEMKKKFQKRIKTAFSQLSDELKITLRSNQYYICLRVVVPFAENQKRKKYK